MPRYFAQLSFKGTRYHGWQVQPNAISVQEILEDALSTLLREKISVVGAGRTDTGVHALNYVFHFDPSNALSDCRQLTYRLNRFLPPDIAIHQIRAVDPGAHARFSAISRTYHYYLSTQKDPFAGETSFYMHTQPDADQMNRAAQALLEYRDFTSFSRLHSDVKTNLCKIYRAEWCMENNMLVFQIKADRFLRNMVRAIVGTLLEVGKGKISIADFKRIIEQKDRGAAGASAPAHALFLVDVEYPEEIMAKK
jgi:tRNA pseudouridine38-40 synthase